MSINFRYDGYTYPLWGSGSRVTTPSLCYRKDGTTYYIPLLTSRSQTIGDYVYYASGLYMKNPLCVKKDGITYYATFFRNLIYDIPAGTYDPSSFENLIKNYISQNGTRTLKNSCTISVVNLDNMSSVTSSVTIASGTTVRYKCPYSYLRGVLFSNKDVSLQNTWMEGLCSFTTYSSRGSGFEWTSGYASYGINTTGIKFN